MKDLEATACYNLGLAYDDCGEHTVAKTHYERALAVEPAYAYPHSRLAKLAYESGDLHTASRHSQAACDLEPNDPVLWFRLALVLLNQERANDALNVLKAALERFPVDSDLNGLMGRALGQVGLLNEAENAIRHSITLDSKNATSWYNLGFCRVLQRRFDESRDAMQKALVHAYPDQGQIERFVEMLSLRLRKHASNHKFQELGERLEKIRETHEQGLLNSLDFLKGILDIARDVVEAENQTDPEEEQDRLPWPP